MAISTYTLFTFKCEGIDSHKQPFVIEHEFIHHTELEARRETIFVLNNMHGYYPKKITLLKKEPWEPSQFENL